MSENQIEINREELFAEATALGLSFPKNIPTEKLVAAIQEKKDSLAEASKPEVKKELSESEATAKLRAEASKLVRVLVHCNNPNKTDLQGEWLTCGNDKLGHMTRYVPYGTAWHVEEIFIDMLKQRTYQAFAKRPKSNNTNRLDALPLTKQLPEFTVQILPPLTPEEIEELRREQTASGRLERTDE